MKPLDATASVACPAEFVSAFVEARLRRTEGPDRKLHLRLRTPSSFVGFADLVDLERTVVAELRRRSPLELEISWAAEPGGPFPHFIGRITTVDAGPERSVLRLAGSYEPPLGAVGSVFDSAIGYRIARGTATDFVQRLREDAEADYKQRMAL